MVLVKDKPLEEQELEEGQKEEGDQAMEILEKKDQENEIVEEAQEKSVDKDKADFLDRFRQHMCKIVRN